MADNIIVKDATGANVTLRTTDNAGVHTPHHTPLVGGNPLAVGNPMPVTGALTDTQLRAAAVPVSGPVTDAQLRAAAVPVKGAGQDVWTTSFAKVGASYIDPAFFTTPVVGSGVGYSQAAGSLLVTTGTATNAEFLTRSVISWTGSLRMRASIVASQRIANQNLQITLADLIGEALTYAIVSATVVDVTKPSHGFTSANVGQSMNLGGITGAAGVPGRYAIASIPDANTIRFTVAGWPGSGSGTLSLFGWNYYRNLVNGVTPTNIAWDAQRKGWASGDTTATINTTASPGLIIQNDVNGRDAFLMDSVRATSLTPNFVTRASRYENLPDADVPLYVFIWSYNGTVAPASTTTWTVGFIAIENFANNPVFIQGSRANGFANALPVQFPAAQPVSGSVTVSGTVTANIGTGSLAAGVNAVGDVGLQIRANNTGAASPFNYASPATPAGALVKSGAGRLVGINLVNTSAGVRWVKFFNATAVTMGTTAAAFEFPLAAGQALPTEIGAGLGFATGIMIAVTSARGLTDNTTTGLALGDVSGFLAFA